MNRGFTNWDGNIADIGPIYPFVGWELTMVLILVVIWVVWHIWQIQMENQQLDGEAELMRKREALQKALQDEHTLERM